MDAKICDRCGATYRRDKGITMSLPTIKFEVGKPSYIEVNANTVDLCEECAEALKNWFEVVE